MSGVITTHPQIDLYTLRHITYDNSSKTYNIPLILLYWYRNDDTELYKSMKINNFKNIIENDNTDYYLQIEHDGNTIKLSGNNLYHEFSDCYQMFYKNLNEKEIKNIFIKY